MLLGADHDRHHVGVVTVAGAQHAGFHDALLDQRAGHGIAGCQRAFGRGRTAEHQVAGIRLAQRVLRVPGVVFIFNEVFVDAASAGHVDELHLIDVLRPVVGQAVLRDFTQVVRRAFAGHLAACGNGFTQLVNDHFVGEEFQRLFVPLQAVVAGGRLTAQLDGDVERHAVAGVRGQIVFDLNDCVF